MNPDNVINDWLVSKFSGRGVGWISVMVESDYIGACVVEMGLAKRVLDGYSLTQDGIDRLMKLIGGRE